MGNAIDLNRYQARGVVTLSYDLDRKGDGGGVTPPSASSDFQLKSTGDVLNPQVGDLLYTENTYVSTASNPPNLTLTTYTWKRDGVTIATVSGATQYMLVSDDIGSVISCDIVFAESGGTLQPLISKSLSSVVSGSSGFTIGDLQFDFDYVWLMTQDKYPLIQSYNKDNPEEAFKVHNLNGTGASWCPPETANMLVHSDLEGGYCAGTSINGRMFLTEPLTVTGENWTYVGRFQVNSAVGTKYLNKFGTTSRILEWDKGNQRIRLSGLSTPIGSAVENDWLTLIIRCSDTAFDSRYSSTNIKTEIYLRNTTQDSDFTTVNANNRVVGMDGINYGWDNVNDISMRTATDKVKLISMTGDLIDNNRFDNLVTLLDTWL